MKLRHILTWFPVIGIYFGWKYGLEKDSPVQTHTTSNAFFNAVSLVIVMILFFIFVCK